MSQTMKLSFKKLAKHITNVYNPNLILEIGSNDGALIRNFNKKKAICVEPCKNLAKITKRMGYKTYSCFWNMKLAKKIKLKIKKVNLIYSANTLSHIDNINSVFRSLVHVLSDGKIVKSGCSELAEELEKTGYKQIN